MDNQYTNIIVKYDRGSGGRVIETANGKEIRNVRNVELFYENAQFPVIRIEITPEECLLTIK